MKTAEPEVDDESGDVDDDETTIVTGEVNDNPPPPPPPTKASIVTKIKALSVQKPPSRDPVNFFRDVFALFCVCIPVTACFVLSIVLAVFLFCLPTVQIVIGSVYLDPKYCKGHDDIAIFLIVGGTLEVFCQLIDCISCDDDAGSRRRRRQSRNRRQLGPVDRRRNRRREIWSVACRTLSSIAKLVLFVWLIWAAVVVFGFYESVSYEEKDPNYCHPTLYRFLFWKVVVFLAVLALGAVIITCVVCCVCLILASADEVEVAEIVVM